MVEYNETVREIKLRYVGQRFDKARMPLDVLPDLPAFRDLLAALVKDAWRRDNAKRQRLPKGFDRSFTFDLTKIGEGSAIPAIEWNRDVAQEQLPGMADYLEGLAQEAMQGLLEIVDKSGRGEMPRTLPADAIRALNKFGSSLRHGERIEFQGSSDNADNVVYLDAERRKRLITNVKDTYDVRVEGIGTLNGTSLGNGSYGTVELATTYGMITVQVDPAEVAEIYDGNIGAMVQFDLTLELDHDERFKNVRAAHEIDLVDEADAAAIQDVVDRLTEISGLAEGWLDGDGEAISGRAVDMAKEFLLRCRSMVSMMRTYPSVEGGVTIQIRDDRYSASVDFEPDGQIDLVAIGRAEPYDLAESYQGVDGPLIRSVAKLFRPEGQ